MHFENVEMFTFSRKQVFCSFEIWILIYTFLCNNYESLIRSDDNSKMDLPRYFNFPGDNLVILIIYELIYNIKIFEYIYKYIQA